MNNERKRIMEEEAINEKAKKNVFKKKEIWISGLVGLIIGGLIIYLLSAFGVIGIRKRNNSNI